jgi:phosphonate transport system substrate-binding protein
MGGSQAWADTETNLAAITDPPHLIRFGFSSRIFAGFNENNASAAVKTWVRTLAAEHGIPADPNPIIYNNQASLVNAVRHQQIDAITMTMDEYWSIRNQVKFDRMIGNVRADGKFLEEYVLLVRKDSGINHLADLKNRSLLELQSPSMSLAHIWLDTELMKQGLPPSGSYCDKVSQHNRLARVILPVFFRQCDACLVTRDGFETICELNPEVGKELKIMASSPAVLPGGCFFNASLSADQENQLIEQLKLLHTTPAGQQVLTVFQTERMEERSPESLASSLALLEEHQRLSDAAQGITSGVSAVNSYDGSSTNHVKQ